MELAGFSHTATDVRLTNNKQIRTNDSIIVTVKAGGIKVEVPLSENIKQTIREYVFAEAQQMIDAAATVSA
jgi:hypothetical protein